MHSTLVAFLVSPFATVFVATGAAVWPAAAETLRPAPDYFVEGVFATTTAQQVALSCPDLSFELLRAAQDSGEVMGRLREDGFDSQRLEEQMVDPAETFAALQADFLSRHGLEEGAAQGAVCDAGYAEIAAESHIGRYLVRHGE